MATAKNDGFVEARNPILLVCMIVREEETVLQRFFGIFEI